MNVVTSVQPVLEAGVSEFLRKHNAEAQFQQVCELARECYPDMRGMAAFIQEDPDVEDRAKVIVSVSLPASYPSEQLHDQWRNYHQRLVRELPLSYCPLFALFHDFLPG